MNWKSLIMRAMLTVLMVAGLLYWADFAVPMGALLVFLLVLSVGTTWAIITILRDDEILASMFDDRKKR